MSSDNHSLTYLKSGVDIQKGNHFVKKIAPLAAATKRPGVCETLGGFGALFDLKSCGFQDPLLVSGTDGVGTKLLLAIEADVHNFIGIDLVAMCVNDIVTQGATPLFFMDYLACGQLELTSAQAILTGIAQACQAVGCALIGGETAEMPGLYKEKHYDLAGFVVGAVERENLLPKTERIRPGYAVIGLSSQGIHANGFSLVRHILKEHHFSLGEPCPFNAQETLGQALLKPTHLYVKPILNVLKKTQAICGLAHITGGGLIENIPRVIPRGLRVKLHEETIWPLPPLFAWLQDKGQINNEEMLRVFNCGIGMAIIVSKEEISNIIELFRQEGEKAFLIGVIDKE